MDSQNNLGDSSLKIGLKNKNRLFYFQGKMKSIFRLKSENAISWYIKNIFSYLYFSKRQSFRHSSKEYIISETS